MFALLLLVAGADPQPYTVRVHTPIVYTVVNHCPLVVPTPAQYPTYPPNYGYVRPVTLPAYGTPVYTLPMYYRSVCPGGVCPR